ncbi:protogenin, partial [Aplysia californica]|uniref:Protogenin n=1 Tax=Aplysia californica TaxID=6500 RepID=A0ABM1A4E1_APLCA
MHETRVPTSVILLVFLMSTLEVPTRAELQLLGQPGNMTVMLDRRLKLPCKHSGEGKIDVKWYHNNEEMPRRGQNYKITHNGRLKFTQVKVIDRGKYHCKVENEYKERVLSRVANLVVHAPAEVIDKHQLTRPRHVRVGAYARLSCQAAGIPPPRIEWRKNGELVSIIKIM